MEIFCYVIGLVFLVVSIQCEEHLYAHGPFGKAHLAVEIPNPLNCNRTIGLFSRFIRSKLGEISELNVSARNYSNMEKIFVSWKPSTAPCKDDFIGIYFVEIPVSTGACDYVDFEFVSHDQKNSTWSMLNLRRPLEFRYYSRDDKCAGKYIFQAKSLVVQPKNVNEATQVHLALGDRNDQIYVSYVSNSSEVTPQCEYGLSSSSLSFRVNGTSITYKASDMCEGKANKTGPQTFINPGYMHTMLLQGLRPYTTYYYRVGSDEHGWSVIHQFINRPSSNDERVHLLAYGDMGVSPIQSGAKPTIDRVLGRVIADNVTAILHIGDISYARGIGALWEGFMSQIEATAARVPYMVGIGNHEYDHITGGEKDPSKAPGPGGFRPSWGNYGSDSGGECAVPVVHRFHSPSNGNGLFWYSFDIGAAHIVYFSTEHDFLPSSPQYLWLEKDLKSVDRSRTPWLIVGSHRPMYSSLEGTDIVGEHLQEYIEPLLYKYHVDLHLFAHIHSYERTCPVYQKRCVKNGVTQVLIGMGGHDLSNGKYSHADWSVYHDIDYGYTHISLTKTELSFYYHHTSDNKIVDQFKLTK